jgi:hypothetical protein
MKKSERLGRQGEESIDEAESGMGKDTTQQLETLH